MKVLYYSPAFDSEKMSGGVVIRKRNLHLLKKMAGEDNVRVFIDHTPNTRIRGRTEKIKRFTGTALWGDRELYQSIQQADVLFIDGTFLGSFSTPVLRKNKAISFFHNVELDYFCQEKKKPNDILGVLKYRYNRAVFFRYEKRICRYSNTIITLNQRDSDRLKQLYGRGADLILPTSMDDSYTEDPCEAESPTETQPYLLFIGSDFFGNTEGLFRFCDHCMPAIHARLIIAGKGMEKYNNLYHSDQISFYGYTDDLAALYRNAAAVVLPIISGCGMKTKTCEAMMHGKVIFGTRESFEGYQLSEDCILCESSEEFIEKINAYLEYGPRYFSSKNRMLYLENYESSVVARKFYHFFSGVKR